MPDTTPTVVDIAPEVTPNEPNMISNIMPDAMPMKASSSDLLSYDPITIHELAMLSNAGTNIHHAIKDHFGKDTFFSAILAHLKQYKNFKVSNGLMYLRMGTRESYAS